mgnify:CR=1 FL=1
MTINLSMPKTGQELKPRITVVGVGGAGGNAVNNMIRSKLEGVEFVVANTDAQALAQTLADRRIQLGVGLTQGLGAGARPDVGRSAAEEALPEIMEHLMGSHMVFIAAGMGGGTGTGAAPVIARAAREQGILTVGVVTKPFHFEGQHRMRLAEAGIEELQHVVDTLIIIPNQNLFRIANERTTFADAFKMADDVLYSGVRGVTDLMVMPGLINLDFADIRTVMSEMGKAMMGTGEAEGENRALDAAQKAISNPLLDDVSMKGAKGVLINITGGPDMTLFEVDEAANRIRDEVDPEANIIFGSTFDETMTGRMRVSVVATGIDAAAAQPRPTVISLATSRPARPAGVAQDATPRPESAVAIKAEPTATLAVQPQTVSVAPIVAEASPAPAQPAPQPQLTRTEPSFIPPRPVEPQQAHAARIERAADPFAAAAMENGGARVEPARERRRGPSLFERVTGTGRARAQAAQSTSVSAPPQPAPAPQPQPAPQPRLGGLDPADRVAPPSPQDDLLDIPAFLRRQAN